MAKAIKRQAMGRGLSALLKDPENDIQSANDKNADKVVGNIVELEMDAIEVNPFQPRTSFNEDTLKELASSIKELGVIQPITVRKSGFNSYQLVSGERRYRASKLIGLKTIPAYIRIANDQESLEMALVENIQRQDLDPVEIAISYQRLLEEINLTQEELSNRVGKNRSTIANYLRLLKLDPIIQTGMRDGFISMGHGRALISVDDVATQLTIYEKIIENSLSVRDTEALVRKQQQNDTPVVSPSKVIPAFAKKATKEFSDYFDTKTEVKVSSSGKGKLIIPFKNKTDFERISKLIKGEE
ncbi:MAG: chromosome partitioning protein ParB [Flavobacteriaceae bacterium CG_4_8_14_3_um_filter_34_10]|nr:ParB/RepB/Spo0J family partition protein [Flavobacteriia bacterium]OIP51836.1 MAG: chromosome partitioning protein ParB [Flavobacteriaceae bacterium CG2_30_34_30]PIQ18178.1 MAG: chromosome partitioning protein ParB [Flavobacteriaceae bacterium CG18_big_fil_WC_8_21_14_2_50_34_36]PIV48411.1 MAG: chromosome partitioning protein ParB [Flavobacteriaceae bacterium CG02_land_8_20_14_3_00_34_13]PIX08863.1 MAG: chromosome partitioning protein ParB [Flavobacteriaceae bacterium CG_4_8_14_3_um_filter_34